MSSIVNISGYKFITLVNPIALRPRLRNMCLKLGIKGTILVSPEGINMVLAAERASLDKFIAYIRSDERFADMTFKESTSDNQPFNRMLVRLKKEIIAFDFLFDPAKDQGKYIQPKTLKSWLDEGRDVVLLDTRNDYEVEIGTFKNALTPTMKSFKDFKKVVADLNPEMKKKTIVTFCTGGVRCEKAAPYMEQQGFKDVYQIEGGILKYFEDCGGDHWDGECFVFDQRVSLDPALHQGDLLLCYQCRHPLTTEDQKHPRYIENVSCPYCAQTHTTKEDLLTTPC
ncbi:MAG: sulfurtransferase [Alphaproteobacteria bacterium]|nr:sulfurtransferase [Alphaproteobacteria bacterium]